MLKPQTLDAGLLRAHLQQVQECKETILTFKERTHRVQQTNTIEEDGVQLLKDIQSMEIDIGQQPYQSWDDLRQWQQQHIATTTSRRSSLVSTTRMLGEKRGREEDDDVEPTPPIDAEENNPTKVQKRERAPMPPVIVPRVRRDSIIQHHEQTQCTELTPTISLTIEALAAHDKETNTTTTHAHTASRQSKDSIIGSKRGRTEDSTMVEQETTTTSKETPHKGKRAKKEQQPQQSLQPIPSTTIEQPQPGDPEFEIVISPHTTRRRRATLPNTN